MRLEKPILFARADKDRFSDNPTLSVRADNVGFYQINRVFLKKPRLSADNAGFFPGKPTLSERNPYYLIR